MVLDLVRTHVAGVLGHASPEAIDARRAFKSLGFDSLGAVELRNQLAQATGIALPSTLIFDHPNPSAVVDYLLGQAAPSGSPANGAGEPDDARVRRALASIPVDRLRAAGLVGPLMELADANGGNGDADTDAPDLDRFDTLDVAGLVAESLGEGDSSGS
jgi:acyl carrier protein